MMKKYIERPRYFEKLLPFIGKPIIKVLVGQRRVGKSYLLQQVAEYVTRKKLGPIIFIDKESDEFHHVIDAVSLSAHINAQSKKHAADKYFVFIDEVQEITGFENSIRSFAAKDEYELFITGSNSDILSGELSSRLSGRYIEIPVYSLDFSEFCTFHSLTPSHESLDLFLKFGGMPFLRHLDLNESQAFEYLKVVATNIIYKDIVSRYNIRNVSFLDDLIYFLADNIGRKVNAKRITDFLHSQRIKVSVNTVLDYLKYLCMSCVVLPVHRVDLRGKKTFEVQEKYYFQDLGIRNALTGFRISDMGQLLENVVYNHLVIHGFKVATGDWKTREIDFVATRNHEKIYIQVAYLLVEESTIQREFGNLLEIQDNYPKMVISMDNAGGHSIEGVEHLHLFDFLMQQL